jgi:site-specific DNA-methyltransferase (adenine-specific)
MKEKMMNEDITGENYHILFGNALERLKDLPDNSVDSIITDPPYGLSDNKHVADTIVRWVNGERDFIPDGKGFMGKSWDAFVPPPAIWDECYRVLKPGGHLLSFFGTRTQDLGTLAIRLAGFEIRDSIAWLYGSGFPKSLNIGKAITALEKTGGSQPKNLRQARMGEDYKPTGQKDYEKGRMFSTDIENDDTETQHTVNGEKYAGWGTALKPAHEPITVARKPLSETTVANNVLKWGTGGLNIDASRIGTSGATKGIGKEPTRIKKGEGSFSYGHKIESLNTGRFPANIMLDEEAAQMLDEQSGVSGTSTTKLYDGPASQNVNVGGGQINIRHNDSGGASRFFYVAKASKKDRNEGLEETNFHPTVKPTALMEYLIKLVTPTGGTVLDPFTGSGSTGKAALLNGFKFIGCEMTEEYLPIIEGRLNFAEKKVSEKLSKNSDTLF